MILLIKSGRNKENMTIGQFIGAFKSIVANQWRKECDRRKVVMGKLWQRDFYDHIIRNEADYMEKRKYIEENPDKWARDKLFVEP